MSQAVVWLRLWGGAAEDARATGGRDHYKQSVGQEQPGSGVGQTTAVLLQRVPERGLQGHSPLSVPLAAPCGPGRQ